MAASTGRAWSRVVESCSVGELLPEVREAAAPLAVVVEDFDLDLGVDPGGGNGGIADHTCSAGTAPAPVTN
jgi:hypothetical protein